MERTVVLEGLVNCRDLGGLRRTDGTVTPSGVFFRSENLDRITATGWDQLHALGVRTIVDLRQPRERAKDVQVRPAWLHTIAVDLDGLDHTEFWKDYWENGLVTTALYFIPHVVQLPERAGQALVALATAPAGGVLFHCMAAATAPVLLPCSCSLRHRSSLRRSLRIIWRLYALAMYAPQRQARGMRSQTARCYVAPMAPPPRVRSAMRSDSST